MLLVPFHFVENISAKFIVVKLYISVFVYKLYYFETKDRRAGRALALQTTELDLISGTQYDP